MRTADKEALELTAGVLGLEKSSVPHEQFQAVVIGKINDLLEKDFPGLVNILYRIDVSEHKLRTVLNENSDTDASVIIYELIIERQLKKIEARKDQQQQEDISETDKW